MVVLENYSRKEKFGKKDFFFILINLQIAIDITGQCAQLEVANIFK